MAVWARIQLDTDAEPSLELHVKIYGANSARLAAVNPIETEESDHVAD